MRASFKGLVVVGISIVSFFSTAQEKEPLEKRVYTTKEISTAESVTIDGNIDDAAWNAVPWSGDFTQWQPDEGKAPTQKTKFKVLYDEGNLYIAVRCYDNEPDKIVKRMSRRDGFEGDWVEINIDSYHDLRTAFSFNITAAGVKGDEFISQNGRNWDPSWNPIWNAKSAVDSEGWTAELKIPFTQLRFSESVEQVWGFQVNRRDFRIEERSLWQRVPRELAGWVSNLGELHGIKNVKPQKQLELQPYVVAKTETFEKEDGNPFATGKSSDISVGLDGKIGITNNLTLDFTVNPDFGQVEADPSVIALDGFQVFFEEQRPFFVENKNIFDYRVTKSEAGGPYGRDNLFYSRRIGRSPQHRPYTSDGEYKDQPVNTTILGAAKFSGKTKDGWSIGLLESVTGEMYTEIADENTGDRREELAEPLTNYLITRVQKDFNKSNSFIGGIVTATNRRLTDSLDFLRKAAYSGGLDFKHQWKNRSWFIAGNIIGSKIEGSKEAIEIAQKSHRRLFQRVDADHLSVDENKTSLSGHGGNLQIGKSGGKHFNFETGVTWRSPGLELNDVGFQRNADDITYYGWAGYQIRKPFSIFRSYRVNYNHWASFNFAGDHTYMAFNTNTHAEFKNYWRTGIGFTYEPVQFSDSALRGGPQLRLADGYNFWGYIGTDQRKKVQFNLNYGGGGGQHDSNSRYRFALGIKYVPFDAFNISVRPSYNKRDTKLQYVNNTDYNGGTRYVNSSLDQETFSMSIRLNYTITPTLTIQYYGQPFIATGKYSNFKYITDSKAAQFTDRFQEYGANQIAFNSADDIYEVDENRDNVIDYSFGNPDFSAIEFTSNLVARWEYIPGSEIYLVWSQGVSTSGNVNDELFSSLGDNVFGQTAHNIFLIKATYRFML